MFLRLTRFSNEKPIKFEGILPNFCEYLFGEACAEKVKGLKKTYLDGDEILVNSSNNVEKEVFVVDTYEVLFED
jgi:hypothetical protein